MFIAYVIVATLAAAANSFSAGCDFVRYERVAVNMDRAGVPRSWLVPLGVPKAAGAAGLLLGIGVPTIGVAAASGLVLFFIGAIVTHIRGRFYSFALPVTFLVLAVAALVLRLTTA